MLNKGHLKFLTTIFPNMSILKSYYFFAHRFKSYLSAQNYVNLTYPTAKAFIPLQYQSSLRYILALLLYPPYIAFRMVEALRFQFYSGKIKSLKLPSPYYTICDVPRHPISYRSVARGSLSTVNYQTHDLTSDTTVDVSVNNDTPDLIAYRSLDATYHPFSDICFHRRQAISLVRTDHSLVLSAEEMHGRFSYHSNSKGYSIKILQRPFSPDRSTHYASGIPVFGSHSRNYIHWITEYLPKVMVANSLLGLDPNMPFIITNDHHPNIIESLRALNNSYRDVLVLDTSSSFRISNSWLIPSPSSTVFSFRRPSQVSNSLRVSNLTYFSSSLLSLYKQASLPNSVDCPTPEKVFFYRSSSGRSIHNQDEVLSTLVAHGFYCIDPSTLSFHQQQLIVSECRLLVAQGGAAIANLVFAKSTKVLVLTYYNPSILHSYFPLFLQSIGHQPFVLFCDPLKNSSSDPAHLSIVVPCDKLLEYISKLGYD